MHSEGDANRAVENLREFLTNRAKMLDYENTYDVKSEIYVEKNLLRPMMQGAHMHPAVVTFFVVFHQLGCDNVFKEKELEEKSNVHFLHIPNSDKPVKAYSLDVIISVGYRVKSQRGTQFRQWANKILKEHLLRGYSINQRLSLLEQKMDRRFAIHESELQSLMLISLLPT